MKLLTMIGIVDAIIKKNEITSIYLKVEKTNKEIEFQNKDSNDFYYRDVRIDFDNNNNYLNNINSGNLVSLTFKQMPINKYRKKLIGYSIKTLI